MPLESKLLGNQGEEFVSDYLANLGYSILNRNFHSHHGEIDIVAEDKDCIVFVEVKNYSDRSFAHPSFSISKNKRLCIIHAARFYLMKNKIKDKACRFDVVTIFRNPCGDVQVEHYKNAFGIS